MLLYTYVAYLVVTFIIHFFCLISLFPDSTAWESHRMIRDISIRPTSVGVSPLPNPMPPANLSLSHFLNVVLYVKLQRKIKLSYLNGLIFNPYWLQLNTKRINSHAKLSTDNAAIIEARWSCNIDFRLIASWHLHLEWYPAEIPLWRRCLSFIKTSSQSLCTWDTDSLWTPKWRSGGSKKRLPHC